MIKSLSLPSAVTRHDQSLLFTYGGSWPAPMVSQETAMTTRNPDATIIGDSPAMKLLLDSIARVAPKDITVLVVGETGTSKELVASLVHTQSRRAKEPLVRFNCAAIPGELAEAELFGHAQGAFTGAVDKHRGFFVEANGGTLVLDEVGELSLNVQAKLLRALQGGEIQPIGAGRVERVDVRVIACTNRDLQAEARHGRFREDLYYRLAVVELMVPPLRDHRDDIPALAETFARRYAEQFGMYGTHLSPELIEHFKRSDWPGNVRQLENTIASTVAMSSGGELGVHSLKRASALVSSDAATVEPTQCHSLKDQVEALERSVIARTMAAVGNNRSQAARHLGLSRSCLFDRLKKHGFIANAREASNCSTAAQRSGEGKPRNQDVEKLTAPGR